LDAYLDDTLPGGTATASRTVEPGRAHRVIATVAAALDPDLLMMGPHRGGNLQAQFLGTTTDRVLRTIDRPCWVVRADLALPVRSLAVAVDFSSVSARALDLALTFARRLGSAGGSSTEAGSGSPTLEVAHVAWTISLEDDPDLEQRELLPTLEKEIAAARERTGLADVATIRARVLPGVDPARTVLAHVDETRPDLIVLGTHGRNAVARALLGDVASIVTREAPCDVVLVPTEPGES
jgi:nucleotide-binding universal stress UspA family protein